MLTSPLSPLRWLYRENRVPHYQRLFQRDDGLRQWWKVGLTCHRLEHLSLPPNPPPNKKDI